MKRSINLRLSLIALIAIIVTAAVTTLAYYSSFQEHLYADLKQKAKLLMETEVFQRAYDNSKVNGHQANTSLDKIKPGNLRITWIDADGTVLFDNDTSAKGLANHMDRPEIRQAFLEGEGESSRKSQTMGKNTYYCALLLDNGTVLRVSTQADAITGVLVDALPVVALVSIIVLMACAFIGHLLTRQLMRPIREMADKLDDSGYKPEYKELEPFATKIRSQHEKVLDAAKSRQDFTANVSHELKTPITAISGYAELMETGMVDKDSQAHIAQQIRSNADRLLAQVTDIIQLSELDHKELPRSFTQINLFEIAQECVEEQRPVAKKKNVQLSCQGIPAGINGDPNLIRELLDNLIQNAIKYNKENGTVDVKVDIVGGHPILSVKDTGIGIPAEHQERVFQRFYRVDKSRSRETGGTGLGLAIVKHIVDIHSAQITLLSQPEEGTEIRVEF